MIELHRMKKVNATISKPNSTKDFGQKVECKIKSMAVTYFPSILDFTAN
ncbi:MAG: hypothetical protein PF517_13805 [Salinivirgaceae bacterium]|nr:hypothetical protein [Salinivirgaceae bacterium]